ncbi:MAG: sigma-54 dependent transcriptional regulator [Desulfovibrio sp.]|jgi:two-component system response regulator HydG|nr:sigma-54 dependent transcriptional regulator [Desulfovibrio sp.]
MGDTTILLADDDRSHRAMLRLLLEDWGYGVAEAGDGEEAVRQCRERSFSLVLMDVRMPKKNGLSAMKEIKEYEPTIPVLVMTAFSTVDAAVEAIKSGAYDYLTKPLDFEKLHVCLRNILEYSALKEENSRLASTLSGVEARQELVGNSPPMRSMLELLRMVAPAQATVLISGESGSGKELVARAIHRSSPRCKGPYVAVNCAALSESLLESELFGHEKGAFTGAGKRHEGCFRQAEGGTLFLDEIGEMPLSMQVKLLRVIQEREVTRVGGEKSESVDVRILTATNRDLQREVAAGRFREDLYYRLNVVALEVPPLRERKEDIPLLAAHFAALYALKNKKEVKGFTPESMESLIRYSWPGNVRELENTIERAVVLMMGEQISKRELPDSIRAFAEEKELEAAALEAESPELPASLEELERLAIRRALDRSKGNKSEAAKLLGISRKTLHMKLQKGSS